MTWERPTHCQGSLSTTAPYNQRSGANSVARESTEEELTPPEQDEAEFATQARAAGITLPRRARRDPAGALVVVVAVIVLAAGIGEITGWIDPRTPAPYNGNYLDQTCMGVPVQSAGGISSAVDPGLVAWLEGAGENMSAAVGGCFSVSVTSESGDGYLSLFGPAAPEFVASYGPPSGADTAGHSNPVAVVPITLGAVAIVYNLAGVGAGLRLNGTVLAGIYDGTITSWNAPAIVDLNPGVSLSGLPPITAVHFATGQASTEALTEYLSADAPSWNSSIGSGMNVSWPGGVAETSDAAMVQEVSSTPGAVGYVELFGGSLPGLEVAQIEDSAGDFASPNAVDTWIAASSFENASAVRNGSWEGFSLAGAGGAGAYPLGVLTYVGLFRDLGVAYSGTLSLADAGWLLSYLYWLTLQPAVAPLPPAYSTATVNALNNETYDGSTIIHLENENGEDNDSGGGTDEF